MGRMKMGAREVAGGAGKVRFGRVRVRGEVGGVGREGETIEVVGRVIAIGLVDEVVDGIPVAIAYANVDADVLGLGLVLVLVLEDAPPAPGPY